MKRGKKKRREKGVCVQVQVRNRCVNNNNEKTLILYIYIYKKISFFRSQYIRINNRERQRANVENDPWHPLRLPSIRRQQAHRPQTPAEAAQTRSVSSHEDVPSHGGLAGDLSQGQLQLRVRGVHPEPSQSPHQGRETCREPWARQQDERPHPHGGGCAGSGHGGLFLPCAGYARSRHFRSSGQMPRGMGP